jgi:hypothetical protein
MIQFLVIAMLIFRNDATIKIREIKIVVCRIEAMPV